MTNFDKWKSIDNALKLSDLPRKRGKNSIRRVDSLPKCDMCDEPAHYDGLTLYGMWGYMCHRHYIKVGVGLGLGMGQELIVVKGGDEID